MIRIGIIGGIGSGKSHISNLFNFPVFNADSEVAELYNKNFNIFKEIKKKIPKHISTFPIQKKEISNAIISNKSNLKKIIKIVHPEIQKKLKLFLIRNKKSEIIILDIPLLLENKINKKNDIIVFIKANKKKVYERLKKRANFNPSLIKRFKEIQLSLEYKSKRSNFVIKNNFNHKLAQKNVKNIVKEILKNA